MVAWFMLSPSLPQISSMRLEIWGTIGLAGGIKGGRRGAGAHWLASLEHAPALLARQHSSPLPLLRCLQRCPTSTTTHKQHMERPPKHPPTHTQAALPAPTGVTPSALLYLQH